jgi:hypothetical protein
MAGWKCPSCLQDVGQPTHVRNTKILSICVNYFSLAQYAIPTLSVGGSRFAMSCEPLTIYNIYFDNKRPGNPHEASAHFLESMCRGRYVGNVSCDRLLMLIYSLEQEQNLRVLELKFTDLADGKTKKQIACNRSVIVECQE